MEREERHRFREALLARKGELLAEGDEKLEPSRKDAVAQPDEDEQPLTEMNQSIASSRNLKRAKEIAAIDRALEKLRFEPDDFGCCEKCEEEIGARRLELMPWARYCIECKSAVEDPIHRRRRHAGDLG